MEKAKLQAEDRIVHFADKEVKKYSDLLNLLQGKKAGETVSLKVIRGKDKLDFKIQLESRPTPKGRKERPSLGVNVEEAEGGLKISEVTAGSSGEKAGLKVGDLLTKADGNKLDNRRVLFKTLVAKQIGNQVKLEFQRGKETKTVDVTLEVPTAGTPGRPYSSGMLGGQNENVQDQQGPNGFQTGGVYKTVDGGETWTRLNSINPRPFYFSNLRVDPNDENRIWVLGVRLEVSTDGGKTFSQELPDKESGKKDAKYAVAQGVHDDMHCMWIDPRDGRHIIMGSDGGIYQTQNLGKQWDHLNYLALGQFYHVAVDTQTPYHVYGGLQDNGSWGGPSLSFGGRGPTNDEWRFVNGGDGFVCQVDPTNPDIVYAESQDGMMMRRNLKTGASQMIRPRIVAGASPYRFNWNTPFILSHHNPRIFYSAGNYVFRSISRGTDQKIISPEITLSKRGSATALSESPKNPDILWVGSDDGAVYVTRDGGKNWTNVTPNFQKVGLPGPRWVASIEASRFEEKRAYIAFDAHRSNDDNPYLFVTEDLGATWKLLRGNLPLGSSRVLREDRVNPNLLYLGTEFAVYVSLDRGENWSKLNGTTLPTVAIHEFAQPITANEIVVATHGRSLWVLDVTTLRQINKEIIEGKPTLFTPGNVTRWQMEIGKGAWFQTGTRKFVGDNPPRAALIAYTLKTKPDKISLKITDVAGNSVATLAAPDSPGFHQLEWNLRRVSLAPTPKRGKGKKSNEPNAMAQFFPGTEVPPGQYRVTLTIDGKEFHQSLTVLADPRNPSLGEIVDEMGELRELQKQLKPKPHIDEDN